MRTILFRGKRTDNNEWIYGSLVVAEHLGPRTYITDDIHHHVQVIPETVGQLLPKVCAASESIYEGDILRLTNGGEWADGANKSAHMQGVGVVEMEGMEWRCSSMLLAWAGTEKIEKIGNIHDNPELLP